ncbi:hypothetical protein FIV41_03175 [Pseudomonas marginalis]|uniref:Chemotaxis methyl-accepting receptor HlyB-like 4HB MCP domain-containing protein n=1 Tax=Pseudomonas marginalis TaxID=298 RepID=A0A9X9G0E9_PSEMA|nr:hypothetical protein FIV41_03175 [Pseudomonas marginalis]
MSVIKNMKLKSKLLFAFGMCAVITIVVAVIGQSGLNKLNAQVDNIVGNLVLSVGLVRQTNIKTVATNRDFYRAIALVSTSSGADELESLLQSYKTNKAQAEESFNKYLATSMEQDERAAAADYASDWPAYTAAVERGFAALSKGDIEQAKKSLYLKSRDNM